jgi:ubiquinone/menaquinone biosynthesis C-methylase UbiE
MRTANEYLMENDEEARRLDIKTDPESVRAQALWCGMHSGARVLDVGCGAGRATSVLHSLVQPRGEAIGVDFSEARIRYARKHYGNIQGINFQVKDFQIPMEDLGEFDFIWVKFVLEYFRDGAVDIIKNLTRNLKPDGWLCLLDLDYNCLNHWELPAIMESTLVKVMQHMEQQYNFDLYAGRKLYAYLYDLKFRDIHVHLMPHHLIYGELNDVDAFNWMKKIQVVTPKVQSVFEEYPGGAERYYTDFSSFFRDPRRFTYTPLIICKGRKPRGDKS